MYFEIPQEGHLATNQKQFRSNHQRCSIKKGVLRNFAKFAGKHLCQILFFNKVAGLEHRCFPVNFVKFLRTSVLQNTSWRLLLTVIERCSKCIKICFYVSYESNEFACQMEAIGGMFLFTKSSVLHRIFLCDFSWQWMGEFRKNVSLMFFVKISICEFSLRDYPFSTDTKFHAKLTENLVCVLEKIFQALF